MSARTACLLAVLVSIAVVAIAVPNPWFGRAGGAHNLIAGSRVRGDRLVLRQTVYQTPMWQQAVSIQRVFAVSKYEKITLLRAMDQVYNGTGAYVNIVRGGPGTSNVTLRFQSQLGRGINFIVELYAK